MKKISFTYWKAADGKYLGYLNNYPDHWTQGNDLNDLREHLVDLLDLFEYEEIPGIKHIAELEVASMKLFKNILLVGLSILGFNWHILAYAIELDLESNTVLDRIVAVVDEDVITNNELQDELVRIKAQLQQRGVTLPQQEMLEHQVLERMISKRLQLQAAGRAGIKVDDASLERAINSIATKNKLSLMQLRDTLEKEGTNFAQFREDTRQQIQIVRLQTQEVVNRINVTDQEVESFLHRNQSQISGREAVRLQHILVATPDGATPAIIQRAQDKVDRLMQQLRAGADFSQVALISSDGRQALESGDLGWMPISQVPTIAADVAHTFSVGAISDPIRSASGFHIFKIMDIKGGGEHQLITQTHARHILIKTNELISDVEAETRLIQLRMRLLGGESFETLARSHSDDTASAIKGGDLRWINPGDTVPEFEEQMQGLSVNEIGKPFHSTFGWHLLQVLERRQHDNTEDNLKTKARESLRARKVDEALDLWLRRVRDEAYVEVRLERAQE